MVHGCTAKEAEGYIGKAKEIIMKNSKKVSKHVDKKLKKVVLARKKDKEGAAKEGSATDGSAKDVAAKEDAPDALREVSANQVAAKEVAAKEVAAKEVAAKECTTKEAHVSERATNVGNQQKRGMDTTVNPKWAEQKKKLRLPETNSKEVEEQNKMRIAMVKVKQVQQQNKAPMMTENSIKEAEEQKDITVTEEKTKEGEEQQKVTIVAENASNCIVREDVPQPVVVIDSAGTGADVGDQEAVNSPVRSVPRVIPPGYWDDVPSFDLWSQDYVLNLIPDHSVQQLEVPATPSVADTSCAENRMFLTFSCSLISFLFPHYSHFYMLFYPNLNASISDFFNANVTLGSEEAKSIVLSSDAPILFAAQNVVEATVLVPEDLTPVPLNTIGTENLHMHLAIQIYSFALLVSCLCFICR